jgi:hypothetical protein
VGRFSLLAPSVGIRTDGTRRRVRTTARATAAWAGSSRWFLESFTERKLLVLDLGDAQHHHRRAEGAGRQVLSRRSAYERPARSREENARNTEPITAAAVHRR